MTGNYAIYWQIVRDALRAGRLPLWEPGIFGGFPFLAQPQQNTFYPPNRANLLLPVRVGITLHMVFHVWLAAFGMYVYARVMGAAAAGGAGGHRLRLWRAGRAAVGRAYAGLRRVHLDAATAGGARPGRSSAGRGGRR